MPTFKVFRDGAPKGVAVDGLAGRGSVELSDDGLVSSIRGADKAALEGVVKALAGK